TVTCNGLRELLHAYFDGELEPKQIAACEEHLAACPECARDLEHQQAIRTALTDESFRYRAPPGLADRLVLQEPGPSEGDRRKQRVRLAVLFAVAMAAGILAAVWAARVQREQPVDDPLAREVASAHSRSLLAEHLVDEKSSDRHTVKPWFQGKLDFSPPVPDLREQEFELAGGRLDYLDDRPVAALVYRRKLHVINLFIWPTEADDADMQLAMRRGFQLLHWTHGRLHFWAVSDLNADDLREFAKLVREKS
ncbi:MAG: anti-sigma factor family protein, partial [Gemmataceae bacterium]